MKHLFSAAIITLVLLVVPFSAGAAGNATMNLSDSTISVEQGDQFDITVSVNANGEELDTVRSVVTYDPNILSATNVSLTGEFDRSAPGNYRDNVNGKVSWGGFTLEGPVTSTSKVITITFSAVGQGNAKISLSADSRAISNGEEKINLGSLGSASVTVTEATTAEPGVGLVMISSDTHPEEDGWYAKNSATLSWETLEGDDDISAYYYTLGDSVEDEPVTYLSGSTTEVTINDIEDGVHYFRIKGVQADGKETSVTTRTVKVDVTAPNPFELTAQEDQLVEGESLWLTFATTDETSGVLQYQMAINESEYQVQVSPLEITDLTAGTYFFRVAALDRAGNATYQGRSIRVYPEGTELDRPEGYEETSEIEAIVESITGETIKTIGDNTREVVAMIIIGLFIIAGIAFVLRKRKR